MDDLDHSVLIAEKDWDCFYAESEECSIQQAQLAALDDSGLSDSDDDKTSFHVSSHPAQTRPDVQHKQCPAEERETGITSENSELTENSNHEFAIDEEATSECFGLDQNQSNKESSPTEQSNVVLSILSENGQSPRENETSQANIKSVSETPLLCNSDIEHKNEIESKGAVSGVTEKERWFVTVNYSPVRLREKIGTSGQKKRRKKKLSKNASHKTCSSLNNDTEEQKKIFERQTMQEKFEQPPQKEPTDLPSTTYLNNAHKENYLSDFFSSSPIEPTPDNLVNTGGESPRFILGATTPISPSDSEGERTKQQELSAKSNNEKESSVRNTPLTSNTAKTPDAALGPTRPIFAMSSFWDEMEKLTINDILELRTANKKKESVIPEKCNTLDTCDAHEDQGLVDSKDDSLEDSGLLDDAADSDYFTHVDDCKPDRSSCEFSTLSDYDEEFLQLNRSTNPTPEPCESKEQMQSFESVKCFFQEEDSNQIWPIYQNESNEIVRCYPESDSPLYVCSDEEAQMQDVILTTNLENNMSFLSLLDHRDIMRSTPSPVLSMADVLDDQCLLSLYEILKNDKDSEQFQTRIPDRHISIISFPFSQNPCVPETYDDLFSDFEVGNFIFPFFQSTQCEKTMVPIYSSSHSVVKDLTFPEVKEIVQSDSEDKSRVVTRCASPSGTQHLFFNTNQRNTWRNLSLRRVKFSFMGRTWCRMATSWVSPKTSDMVFKENWNRGTPLNYSIAHPKLPVLLQENQTPGHLTEQQIYVGHTVSRPGRDRFRFSLKQADMCLVCIAFASWVLKSSNPQSTDMWKAALLANVSAISAIQYLRRYKEVTEDEP